MNIAHISPSDTAVSETFIQRHRNTFQANVVFYYGTLFPDTNDKEGSLEPTGFLSKCLQLKYRLRKKVDLLPHKALEKSFLRQGIDVCYAEFGTGGTRVMAVCKKLNIPLIVNFHGYDAHEYKTLEQNSEQYRELFDIATLIVSVSHFMTDSLVILGCPRDKIRYLPCFPDPMFAQVQATYQSNKFLAVGRFVDKKAPYLTLLAFAKAQLSCPDIELNFVGDGPLLNTCINLANSLKVMNVNFLGAISHKKIIELFADSSVFLQHSIRALNGDCEGTPVAIMEASLSGLAVISTNHAGIPDVVINGQMGILVDELDVEAMADAIVMLAKDSLTRNKMGKFAKSYMESNFSPPIFFDRLNGIVEEAMQLKHPVE
jgi:colanic acid/amylovoran biosynthesis glycosyltransferase